ncbi:Protein of unknown function [Propionibacterium freudenreichii]|nr:Protein of unknown function [Propionibacterium freudenreichii]CEI31719.1 Protein of unknown function [Propionibacterium freudenreichii]
MWASSSGSILRL